MKPDPTRRVLQAVEAVGLPFEVIRIDPADADTAVFCARHGCPPERACNTILVASKREPKRLVVCVVPASVRLDVNRRVRSLLGGQKSSFASAEEMAEVTGMEPGGVTPFALPPGIPLYVDRRLLAHDWIILGGGGRDAKIRIDPRVFERLGAQIVDDLGIERPQPADPSRTDDPSRADDPSRTGPSGL